MDVVEHLAQGQGVCLRAGLCAVLGRLEAYEGIVPAGALDHEGGDDERMGCSLPVSNESLAFASWTAVIEMEVPEKLILPVQYVVRTQSRGFQEHVVEKEDFPAIVDDEKAIRKLLDYVE